MFDNDSLFGRLCSIGLMAGVYYLGRKSGLDDYQEAAEKICKDEKIKMLQKQIDELKNQQAIS